MVQKRKGGLPKENAVYELVDYTSEATYYPLGIFKTFDEARQIIIDADLDGRAMSDSADIYDGEILHVIKRKFGLSGNGKTVLICHRNQEVDNWYTESTELSWLYKRDKPTLKVIK